MRTESRILNHFASTMGEEGIHGNSFINTGVFIMEYTKIFETRCPVDSSKVKHTVTFTKGSCSRYPEDIMTAFVCSRNSVCSKCAENYRD